MTDHAKTRFERFLRSILASRFLTVSALIHLLVIVLFGGKLVFDRYVEPADIFRPTAEAEITLPSQPQPSPDSSLPTSPPNSTLPPAPAPSIDVPTPDFILRDTGPSSFKVQVPVLPGSQLGGIRPGPAPAPSHEPGVLPGPMQKRTGPGIDEAISQYGGKPDAGPSVLRALRWLQAQQHSDGTWGSDHDKGAFTGLALLCFLGHGETPRTSHEFGVVVSNGINALVAEAAANENHLNFAGNFDDQTAAYQHGICTYALCEAYTMTKDARLAPIIRQAVDYIVKGQRKDGGWAYRYDTSADAGAEIKSDTSVSGWQIQALKAAHMTGIAGMDKTVLPSLGLAMKNMDRVFNPRDGSYGYRKAADHNYSLTGVGVLARLFWLGRPDHVVHLGLKNIMSEDLSYDGADCNLYAWYYDTQACFQAQDDSWKWWSGRFQDQLTSRQSTDGSWPPTGGSKEVGGLGTAAAGDGPLYRTTLCALMLEVFYRYAPASQDNALSGGVLMGL